MFIGENETKKRAAPHAILSPLVNAPAGKHSKTGQIRRP
jgi:hypothetical protein